MHCSGLNRKVEICLGALVRVGIKNESGFRPPLCTYRLNCARRTSWGWWDDWDDTVLQTQDSKFKPWRSEAEHATSRSRRLPAILTFTRDWGRHIFCFFQAAETGNRTPNSGVEGSGANHYPRAPAPCRHKEGWNCCLARVVFCGLNKYVGWKVIKPTCFYLGWIYFLWAGSSEGRNRRYTVWVINCGLN